MKEYPTLKIDDLKKFVISPHGNKNSMMAMWTTGPYIGKFPELMEAWGYKPMSTLFTWIKINKNITKKFESAFVDIFSSTNISNKLDEGDFLDAEKMGKLISQIKLSPDQLMDLMNSAVKIGMGYHTRANAEFCIYGKKGRGIGIPAVRNIKEVIISIPRSQHSAKPLEAYERLELLYPNATKLELFARERYSDQWMVWGNDPHIQNDVEIEILSDM